MKRGGIRGRFLWVLVIVFLFGFIVQGFFVASSERRILLDGLAAKGRSLGTYAAKLSQDPLIMRDGLALDNIVNGVKKDEDVLFTIVVDARDEIVTSQFASVNYRSPRLKKAIAGIPREADLRQIIQRTRAGEEHREITVPILSDRQEIGRVMICLSTFAVNRQVLQTIGVTLATFLFLMLTLGTILYLSSKRFILDPVAELGEAAARLAAGDLSARVRSESTGELQTLIETFNRMSEQLQRTTVSKDYVDNIIGSMIDTLIVIGPDGTVKRGNRSLCRLLGYEEQDLVGRSAGTILRDPEDENRGGLLNRIRAHGFVSDIETIYVTREGKRIPMLFSGAVVRGAEGEDRDIVGVAQDITLRKAAGEELIRAREAAENASRLKSEFLSNISHEIRTPLNGVLGMTEILLSTPLKNDQREYLEAVRRSGQNLLKIIEDILDFSQIESGRMAIMEGDFDLREMLEGVVDSLFQQAADKNLELACLLDPAVPTSVRGDKTRLRQVLMHLGSNAIKFTQQGEILVEAESLKERPDRLEVRFAVTDTGIGIPEEKREMIFEGFTQVDGSSTRSFGGTGIGLSISKQLVDMMSGTIGVESQPGRGSRFWFTVELARRASTVGEGTTAASDEAKARVLIAHSDVAVGHILQRMLLRHHDVTFVTTGEEAIGRIRAAAASGQPFQILVMNGDLRDEGGDFVAKKIRQDPRFAGLHLLCPEPPGGELGMGKLRSFGIEAFISRPIKQGRLLEGIAGVLR